MQGVRRSSIQADFESRENREKITEGEYVTKWSWSSLFSNECSEKAEPYHAIARDASLIASCALLRYRLLRCAINAMYFENSFMSKYIFRKKKAVTENCTKYKNISYYDISITRTVINIAGLKVRLTRNHDACRHERAILFFSRLNVTWDNWEVTFVSEENQQKQEKGYNDALVDGALVVSYVWRVRHK